MLISLGALWVTSRVVRRPIAIRRLLLAWFVLAGVSLAFGVAMVYGYDNRPSGPVLLAIAVAAVAFWLVLLKITLRAGWGRAALAMILYVPLSAAPTFAIEMPARKVLIEAFHLTSRSMEPTLAVGDRFLVDHTATPKRWDVVVFRAPGEPGVTWAKRLVGFPGETIRITRGEIEIDGSVLPKPPGIAWLKYQDSVPGVPGVRTADGVACTLGPDEVFVLGDNTAESLDSRVLPVGAVRSSDILGVARLVYAPWQRIHALDVNR
jgi:signal peptidase I